MATRERTEKSTDSASIKRTTTAAIRRETPGAILQRMEQAPETIRPADILRLQRAVGNRATQRIIQAKLKLGPAGDQYEQEADRVAKQVVRASRQPDVQRGPLEEDELQMKPLAGSISQVNRALLNPLPSQRLQRYSEDEDELQAKSLEDPSRSGKIPFAVSPPIQRNEMDEEELQAKRLTGNGSGKIPFAAPAKIQRNEMDEEELQAKRLTGNGSGKIPFAAPTKIQRNEMDEDELQAKPLTGNRSGKIPFAVPPQIQQHGAEEEIQATANHGLEGGDVDEGVARSIQSAKGGGAPLDDGVRSSMEQGFGADFSGVRVHTGGQADALNRSLNARAFTTGSDIFFGKGQYNPGSTGGQELIAHELTHTVQQGAAGVQRDVIQRQVTNIQWNNATQAKPSTSGVKGGVFFITVNGTMHVVKATDSVGATRFAEQLVGMLGGANIETTQSIPVPQSDNEHGAILAVLNQLKPAQPDRNQFGSDGEFQEAVQKHQAYETKYAQFQQSPYFLVQQNMFTPGTNVLGTEDLMEDIYKAGGNKGNLQGRVDTEVQAQVNLLTNATLMQAVGRLLAIDSLFGNADRFEEMNVQNAFMRGDDTIGAIDTEAIMQSLTGTTQFAGTDIGEGSVPAGPTDVARYVDFVIGHNTTGGGRAISDDWNGTPSSNLAKLMSGSERDRWFKVTFVPKFVFRQDQMILNKYAQLGFPEDATQGNWVAVQQHIETGFQAGVDAVKTLMTSNQYDQVQQNYQNLSGQYGGTDNFNWDAFRIRGEYMSSMKDGLSHEEARQSILDRMTRRENAKTNTNIPPKVLRVLTFGTTNGLINTKEETQIKKVIQRVSLPNIKKIIHISNRGGLTKQAQKISGAQANVELNNRLEAARVHQLKNFNRDSRFNSLAVATNMAIASADRLRKKDVDQAVYRTKAGRQRARSALAQIGMDVNRWGPNA